MKLLIAFIAVNFLFFSYNLPSSIAASRSRVINRTLNMMELRRSPRRLSASDQSMWDIKLQKHLQQDSPRNITSHPKEQPPHKTDSQQQREHQRARFRVSGGYDINHMHYKETVNSDTIDEDYGYMDGFYLEAACRGNNHWQLLHGKPFLLAYFRRFEGELTYSGSTNIGSLFKFEEQNEISRYGVKFGAYRDLFEDAELFWYFDLGRRVWDRGENQIIGGVITYLEKYHWIYYGIGAGINYPFTRRITMGLDLSCLTTIDPKMKAYLNEGATFELENVYGFDVKIPIKYRLKKNLSLDLTPYFTYWNIDASDPETISGTAYVEPDSRTHIEGVLIGLSYYF